MPWDSLAISTRCSVNLSGKLSKTNRTRPIWTRVNNDAIAFYVRSTMSCEWVDEIWNWNLILSWLSWLLWLQNRKTSFQTVTLLKEQKKPSRFSSFRTIMILTHRLTHSLLICLFTPSLIYLLFLSPSCHLVFWLVSWLKLWSDLADDGGIKMSLSDLTRHWRWITVIALSGQRIFLWLNINILFSFFFYTHKLQIESPKVFKYLV